MGVGRGGIASVKEETNIMKEESVPCERRLQCSETVWVLVRATLVLMASLLTSGCATFAGHRIPETPRTALVRSTSIYHVVGYSIRTTDFLGGDSDDFNCFTFALYDCYHDGFFRTSSNSVPYLDLVPYADLPLEKAIEKMTRSRIVSGILRGNTLTLDRPYACIGQDRDLERAMADRGAGYVASALGDVKLEHIDQLDGGHLSKAEVEQSVTLAGSRQGAVLLLPTPDVRKAIPAVRQMVAKSATYSSIPEPPSWKNWEQITSGVQATNAVVADIEVYSELRYGLPLTIANAVVSGITFTIIPTIAPGDFTMTLRLRTLEGDVVWEQSCKESITAAVGLPIIFWAFSKEHSIITGGREPLGNQFRYLLKQAP